MAKNILIADDDAEIVDLLTTALESAGFKATSVSNGGRLPQVMKDVKPDLLILDVLLPGLDGYSLELQFAQESSTKDLPVIVISGLPGARSLFEKFPQVKLFLEKPFETDTLLKKVKELLGK